VSPFLVIAKGVGEVGCRLGEGEKGASVFGACRRRGRTVKGGTYASRLGGKKMEENLFSSRCGTCHSR